jgi:hypothetical protein
MAFNPLIEGESLRDSLIRQAEHQRENARHLSYLLATIHITVRVMLIALAGIVAAQNNLLGSPLKSWVRWVPVMSLAVAIVTALDTWLKPGLMWKALVIYTIKIAALRDNLRAVDPSDQQAIEKLHQQFRELEEDHYTGRISQI